MRSDEYNDNEQSGTKTPPTVRPGEADPQRVFALSVHVVHELQLTD